MSFSTRLVAPLAACALLLAAAVPALADESVTIAPGTGSQSDTFEVAGSDVTPGLALDINFVSPAGTVFSTAALNQVVVVGSDGTFAFDFVPANEFQGEDLGDWTAQVCGSGTDNCVQTTFTITS